MRKDVYEGYDEQEAEDAYFDYWYASTSFRDIPEPVLDMARYAFGQSFNGYVYEMFDRDFNTDGHESFGFIRAACVAGIRCKDEWTEGN